MMMLMDHKSNNPSDSCGALTGFNTVSQTAIIHVNSYCLNPNPHPNRKPRFSHNMKHNSARFNVPLSPPRINGVEEYEEEEET